MLFQQYQKTRNAHVTLIPFRPFIKLVAIGLKKDREKLVAELSGRRTRSNREGSTIKQDDVLFLESVFAVKGDRGRNLMRNQAWPRKKGTRCESHNSIKPTASVFNGPRRCNFVLDWCHGTSAFACPM